MRYFRTREIYEFHFHIELLEIRHACYTMDYLETTIPNDGMLDRDVMIRYNLTISLRNSITTLPHGTDCKF